MELSQNEIYQLFFEGTPSFFSVIDTGRNDADFRTALFVTASSGDRYVIKLADNDFTSPDRIRVWQRCAEEYRKLGYYCPRIVADRSGAFPTVEYKGRKCAAYAEEFAPYRPLEDREEQGDDGVSAGSGNYLDDIWTMTARMAAKHFDYAPFPSAWCLFETFCPSDPCDEVLDNARAWKKYCDTLPEAFRDQVARIWNRWLENRNELEKVYHLLPSSVFQADLNSSNILLDRDGKFVGICDFNLCGREVFLNYLMRENFDDFEPELESIKKALQIAARSYTFSDTEKQTALMLYRCLKPLWYTRLENLQEAKDDPEATRRCLDLTEKYQTMDIDFPAFMVVPGDVVTGNGSR
ncbi:MAG: hypothetical protein IKH18_01685 [Clostridia bacterium]|nr:hypothetical protein [Clostridia bacterium]